MTAADRPPMPGERFLSKDSNNWRDDLWCRYIRLFDSRLPFRTGLASVPDGWREDIAALLDRVEMIVRADGIGQLTISKLGYGNGMLDIECRVVNFRLDFFIEDIVDRARAHAACSCEVCGAAGRRYMGALEATVRCDTHRVPVSTEIVPPWPLIRIERVIEEGVSRIISCRIYDRDRDAFVEIEPEALGIPRSP
jgi:hypothetical protein